MCNGERIITSRVAGLQVQMAELQRQINALRIHIESIAPPSVAPTGAVPQLQRFIRLADLPSFVGVRRTQICEMMKADEFPRPIPISDTGRAVAWLESEVLSWQVKRIAKRKA